MYRDGRNIQSFRLPRRSKALLSGHVCLVLYLDPLVLRCVPLAHLHPAGQASVRTAPRDNTVTRSALNSVTCARLEPTQMLQASGVVTGDVFRRWVKKDSLCPRDAVVCVFVCVVILFILDVRLVNVPAGVTQEEGHTGFLHLPSAVHLP